ncbi:MAG: PxKF domain-containing protein, partial [Actinobacteria bacterium]|nr:PxKF domain-containing protein [Actinomycetota bacterium]
VTPYSGPDTSAGELDGSCSDVAGNQAEPIRFNFAYDATAPGVVGTPDRAPDHNGWYNHSVTIAWSDEAGDACDPGTVTFSGPDSATASVTGTCIDTAGNTGTGTFSFKYDATAPVVSITTPAEGGIFILHANVASAYECTDDTSGVDMCSAPVPSGQNIDTNSVGEHTFGISAMDAAGNAAGDSNAYRVQYASVGPCAGVTGHQILAPINADGSSVHKQNSTVPAKFRVCDANGVAITAPGVVQSFRVITITSGGSTSDVDQPVPSTSAHESFRAGDQQWIYNISTKSFTAGSKYGFRISLDDGTAIDFSFTVR